MEMPKHTYLRYPTLSKARIKLSIYDIVMVRSQLAKQAMGTKNKPKDIANAKSH